MPPFGNADDDDDMEESLVIGIDFGTTYSGVAWATRADFEENRVNFITSWPGNGREEGKAPTELSYNGDGGPEWGYEVPADGDTFRWFKLLLLRTEDLHLELRKSEFMVRAREMMEESGRAAVDLVADYLRLLWEHIMSTIERARGATVVQALPIHVVITVPAIWKGYARQAMEDAAKKAGILEPRLAGTTKLTLAPEPEAAALSTLLEQGSGVQPDNVYVICDAGGGTVDLISYQVKTIKPTILQEAVEGTGGLCGGIFIDQTFERICKGRLGGRWSRLSKTGVREIMRNEWEYGIKPQFKPGNTKKEYIVSLPAEAFKGQSTTSLDDTKRAPYIKNGRIHFLSTDIVKAFENVFEDIKSLVAGQIQKATARGLSVTGIILVGGLGSSPYLYEYLKDVYSEAAITVLQSGGIKPRTAICRGAIFKGFLEEKDNQQQAGSISAPIVVESTVSRASYGVRFCATFDPRIHLEIDKVWDAHEGVWKANNQLRWYLKRGEMASMMQPVRASWYNLFEEDEFSKHISVRLYQCDDEAPPKRMANNVQQLCTLSFRLDIKYRDLPDFKSKKGMLVKMLSYELELLPSGASLEFALYVDGRKQGSQSVKTRFE